MNKVFILSALLSLTLAGCGSSNPPVMTATPTQLTITPTEAPTLSETPPTPKPTITPIPIMGTLTTRVNVRSGPDVGTSSLGLLNAGDKVQILSKDSQGKWYQILYSAGSQGRGWVAAQFVKVADGVEIPLDATPTPAGPTGRVIQRLNVRSGPGTTFDSLGLLQPDAIVSLTGKNTTASWFQINYPAGPDGRGWVTVQYIQTDAANNLPVLDDYGKPVTTGAVGTESGPAMTPTPTIGPAFPDQDSQTIPAIRVTFSAAGTHQFTYSSQVSVPEGDAEDWVEFTPYAASGKNARLIFSLTCSGNGMLTVELWQGGSSLSGWGTLECGDLEKTIMLFANQSYEVRLSPVVGEGLRLVNYVLTVQNIP